MKLVQNIQLALYGVFFVCTGCASVLSHTGSHEEVRPYPGTRVDGQLLANPNSIQKPPVHPAVVIPISVIDLPLSAALDTLLLPIDLTYRKPETPAAIEIELLEIKLGDVVTSERLDGITTLPVRLRIRNPRPTAVRLRAGRLADIIRCSDLTDEAGIRWKIPWGGFEAKYDQGSVVLVAGRSESVFDFSVLTSRKLLEPNGSRPGVAEDGRAPASLHFKVRDSFILTDSGASIPIRGSGTVSVKK